MADMINEEKIIPCALLNALRIMQYGWISAQPRYVIVRLPLMMREKFPSSFPSRNLKKKFQKSRTSEATFSIRPIWISLLFHLIIKIAFTSSSCPHRQSQYGRHMKGRWPQ
jgi:hypothetical protein